MTNAPTAKSLDWLVWLVRPGLELFACPVVTGEQCELGPRFDPVRSETLTAVYRELRR
jgi:hypothetical protein